MQWNVLMRIAHFNMTTFWALITPEDVIHFLNGVHFVPDDLHELLQVRSHL